MSMLASKLPEMVTHSSILVWEILQTEEPGGLQSIGLLRVEHDWSNFVCLHAKINMGFPGGSDGKEFTCNAGDLGLDSWVRKTPWWREWLPTSLFLPGECHGQRSLAGYSLWAHKELDITELLSTPMYNFQTRSEVGEYRGIWKTINTTESRERGKRKQKHSKQKCANK